MAASYQTKINARSPHFIIASATAGYITSATLEVYIWSGAFASQPATATYTIQKNALTATSTDIIFEISALIRDSFVHNRDAYADALSTFADALWVEIVLSVVQSSGSQADTNNYWLAVDGYGDFNDGINYVGSDVIVNAMNVKSGEDILFPVFAHSDGIDTVKYYSSAGALQTTIDLTTPEASTNSYDKTQYLTRSSASNTYSIGLFDGGILQETIAITYIEECRNTPRAIKFYDKNGMLQKIWAFARSKVNINSQRDKYQKILTSVSAGAITYSTEKHQHQTYNITANKSIMLNSGWVLEAQNEIWEQLLLSELVWVDDAPVNITTSSFDYKTRLDDKLINYTFNFDYAYNEINNVY